MFQGCRHPRVDPVVVMIPKYPHCRLQCEGDMDRPQPGAPGPVDLRAGTGWLCFNIEGLELALEAVKTREKPLGTRIFPGTRSLVAGVAGVARAIWHSWGWTPSCSWCWFSSAAAAAAAAATATLEALDYLCSCKCCGSCKLAPTAKIFSTPGPPQTRPRFPISFFPQPSKLPSCQFSPQAAEPFFLPSFPFCISTQSSKTLPSLIQSDIRNVSQRPGQGPGHAGELSPPFLCAAGASTSTSTWRRGGPRASSASTTPPRTRLSQRPSPWIQSSPTLPIGTGRSPRTILNGSWLGIMAWALFVAYRSPREKFASLPCESTARHGNPNPSSTPAAITHKRSYCSC